MFPDCTEYDADDLYQILPSARQKTQTQSDQKWDTHRREEGERRSEEGEEEGECSQTKNGTHTGGRREKGGARKGRRRENAGRRRQSVIREHLHQHSTRTHNQRQKIRNQRFSLTQVCHIDPDSLNHLGSKVSVFLTLWRLLFSYVVGGWFWIPFKDYFRTNQSSFSFAFEAGANFLHDRTQSPLKGLWPLPYPASLLTNQLSESFSRDRYLLRLDL
jgi:hypothetical protein